MVFCSNGLVLCIWGGGQCKTIPIPGLCVLVHLHSNRGSELYENHNMYISSQQYRNNNPQIHKNMG